VNNGGISPGSSHAAEASALTLRKLIVDVTGLIRSSKDVLARLGSADATQCHPHMTPLTSLAPTPVEHETDTCRGQERRRREELSSDIVALIASCGERVRRTDRIGSQT